jgi:hypothetical protein
VPLIGALRGPGVSTGPLTGNEEPLDEYGMRIWVDWIRNAVLLTRAQMRKSAYEQLDEVRPLLSEWMQGLTRDEIILALGAIPSESPPANWGNEATAGQRVNGIIYDLATTAQKDLWHTANQDRLLYGSAVGNYLSTHALSLAQVDATADKASAKLVLLLKRRARRASPGITPFKDNEEQGREWYVLFCGSNAFEILPQTPTSLLPISTLVRVRMAASRRTRSSKTATFSTAASSSARSRRWTTSSPCLTRAPVGRSTLRRSSCAVATPWRLPGARCQGRRSARRMTTACSRPRHRGGLRRRQGL